VDLGLRNQEEIGHCSVQVVLGLYFDVNKRHVLSFEMPMLYLLANLQELNSLERKS
jgi:hypothetical protein